MYRALACRSVPVPFSTMAMFGFSIMVGARMVSSGSTVGFVTNGMGINSSLRGVSQALHVLSFTKKHCTSFTKAMAETELCGIEQSITTTLGQNRSSQTVKSRTRPPLSCSMGRSLSSIKGETKITTRYFTGVSSTAALGAEIRHTEHGDGQKNGSLRLLAQLLRGIKSGFFTIQGTQSEAKCMSIVDSWPAMVIGISIAGILDKWVGGKLRENPLRPLRLLADLGDL